MRMRNPVPPPAESPPVSQMKSVKADGMTRKRRVTVVTGDRSDWALLSSVCRAIQADESLELEVLVTGTHPLPPAYTVREVQAEFPVAATIQMQEADA